METKPPKWQITNNVDGSLRIRLSSSRRLAEIGRLTLVLVMLVGLITYSLIDFRVLQLGWFYLIAVIGLALAALPVLVTYLLFEVLGIETIDINQEGVVAVRQLFWFRQVKVFPASKITGFDISNNQYSRSTIRIMGKEQTGQIASRVNTDVAQNILAILQERFPKTAADEAEETEFDLVAGIAALASIAAPILLIGVPIILLVLSLVFGWLN